MMPAPWGCGYISGWPKPFVKPDEAVYIRFMFSHFIHLCATHHRSKIISQLISDLHNREIYPRRSSVWSHSGIRRLLRTEVYRKAVGHITFNRVQQLLARKA